MKIIGFNYNLAMAQDYWHSELSGADRVAIMQAVPHVEGDKGLDRYHRCLAFVFQHRTADVLWYAAHLEDRLRTIENRHTNRNSGARNETS